jgi:hypothetical protein
MSELEKVKKMLNFDANEKSKNEYLIIAYNNDRKEFLIAENFTKHFDFDKADGSLEQSKEKTDEITNLYKKVIKANKFQKKQ